MRLHRLEVTAFGPFAGTETVDFDEVGGSGLFLLHGPTGAGKTTLLDAVCFALFGQVPGARAGARHQLRSDHAPADRRPSVRLELSVGGRRLEVARSPEWQRPKRRGAGTTRSPASTTVRELVEGEWVPLTSRNDEAAHLLQQLVGMGIEQFTKVVLLPQGEFATFLRSDADSRRAVLCRLFEIDRYTGVEAWLSDERRRLAREVEHADRRTGELVGRAVEAAAGLPEVTPPDVPDTPATAARAAGFDAERAAPIGASLLDDQATRGDDADERKPVLVVGELVDRVEAATRAVQVRLLRCEERLSASRHAATAAVGLAELQRRHRAARESLAALDTELGALDDDRRRLAAARQVQPLGPLLAARRDAADVWYTAAHDVARAASAPALHPWLALPTDDPLARTTTAELGSDGIPDAHAGLQTLLPGSARCEERRSVLASQRVALQSALARLDSRAALAADVARLTTAVAGAQQQHGSAAARLASARQGQGQTAAQLERLRSDLPDLQALEEIVQRARRLLEHAEEQTSVQQQVDVAETTLRDAVDREQGARDRVLDVRERRLQGIAAELAQALRPGKPCPVCGSAEHPSPALAGEDHVDRGAEQEAARAAQLARVERDAAAAALASLRSRAAQLAALTTGLDVAAARQGVHDAADALRRAQQAHEQHRAVTDAHRRAVAEAEQRATELAALAQELSRQQAQAAEARGRLMSAYEDLRASLSGALGGTGLWPDASFLDPQALRGDLQLRAGALEDELAAIDALSRARDHLQATFDDLDAVHRRLRTTADECGVDDVDVAAGSLLPRHEMDRLAASVESRQARHAELTAEVGRPELLEAARSPEPELAALQAAVSQAESELRRATAEHAICERSAAALRRLHAELTAHELTAQAVRQRHARLDDLSRCVDGTGGGNGLRMRLSAYVLAARLEQVAAAATERLQVMSGGRYALVHSDEVSKGGARSGLALRVVDGWTGAQRDTATLSGGESFLASLALALGLADVVQAETGGTSIETLFVDEGFGTLDDETLDEVMGVLDGLRDGGRTVGVVSHVAELRHRIPSRVEVEKHRDGSRLVVHDACA